jgi:hypothetical protein
MSANAKPPSRDDMPEGRGHKPRMAPDCCEIISIVPPTDCLHQLHSLDGSHGIAALRRVCDEKSEGRSM